MSRPTPPSDYDTTPASPRGPQAPPEYDTATLPVLSVFTPSPISVQNGLVYNALNKASFWFNFDADRTANPTPSFTRLTAQPGRNVFVPVDGYPTGARTFFVHETLRPSVSLNLRHNGIVALAFPLIYAPGHFGGAAITEGFLQSMQYYSREHLLLEQLLLDVELWRANDLIDLTSAGSLASPPITLLTSPLAGTSGGYTHIGNSLVRSAVDTAGLAVNELPRLGNSINTHLPVVDSNMGLPILAVLKYQNEGTTRDVTFFPGAFVFTQRVPATASAFTTLEDNIHMLPVDPLTTPEQKAPLQPPVNYPTAPAGTDGPQAPADYDTSPAG